MINETLLKLTTQTKREDSNGRWRVILEWDNYHDGAQILDGDGNLLAECYDFDKTVDERLIAAIEKLEILED